MTEEEIKKAFSSAFPQHYLKCHRHFLKYCGDEETPRFSCWVIFVYMEYNGYVWNHVFKENIAKKIVINVIKQAKEAFAKIDWKKDER